MKVESLQQTSFLLYKSRIWTFILGSVYIFEKRNSGEKNISISAAYPQDRKSKRANEVYQIFLPDPRARFTKQGLWWQYLYQNCDLLLFNGVGILAGGIFYGCSGVAVYDRRWEARDGYGFVLINTNGMQAESATWSRLTKRRILMNTHQHRLKETWSKSLSDHWEGKQSMMIRSQEQVRDLKRKMQDQLSIPASLQNLIYAGKSLHKDCKSPESDSIIILNLRFIGGCRGCS